MGRPGDDDDCVSFARRRVARRFRIRPWEDDVVSAAAAALWRAGGPGLPYAAAVVNRAAIDELRRLMGDSRAAARGEHVEFRPELGHGRDGVAADAYLHPVDVYGFTGRDAVVVRMLVDGFDKQDVAAAIGVSPGRVSHLLTRYRERVREAECA